MCIVDIKIYSEDMGIKLNTNMIQLVYNYYLTLASDISHTVLSDQFGLNFSNVSSFIGDQKKIQVLR